MRASVAASAWLTMTAIALAALPALAWAQDAANQDPLDAYALALSSPERATLPAPPPDVVPAPDESAVLGQALMFDPASVAGKAPAKSLRLPGLSNPHKLAVTRTNQPDGSGTVVVKQPISTEWGANVGADFGLAPSLPSTAPVDTPLPQNDRSSGAAWASLGVVPNLASVDARLDPTNDQSRLGTTFKHSIPVGRQLSVTLQDSYSVTESFGPTSEVADAGGTGAQVFGNERRLKFDILPTGTSLGAGLISTSIDPVTHNTFSADQKLLGPLHVTTAVTDIGQPTLSKSITAGFKLNW